MKTINYYVKNRKARFIIRIIAATGYVILGALWWTMYGLITILYHLTCEVIETLFVFVEGLAAARYKLQQLHKSFSYLEMILIALGCTVITIAMISLLWMLTIIVPAGY